MRIPETSMTSRIQSNSFASLFIAVSLVLGTQTVLADVIAGAGPGGGPTKNVKSGGSQNTQGDKHKGEIEVISISPSAPKGKVEIGSLKAGATESSKDPKAPGNVKAPDKKPSGALLVPAVQKAR